MIQKITDRIYVIEHEEAANNVIIFGNKHTILVDTSLFPEKAKKIDDFVYDFAKKRIDIVLNTHYHPDHTFGNSAFDCTIIAHTLTREKMSQMNEDYMRSIGVNIDKIQLPNVVFDDEFVLEDGLTIIFRHGPGHTSDSSYVYIKEANVLVTGDTVINDMHPEIVFDSSLEEWIETLENLPKAKTVVPGHGKCSDESCIASMIDYLIKFRKLVNGEINAYELEKDKNFSQREHYELLEWSLKNILNNV